MSSPEEYREASGKLSALRSAANSMVRSLIAAMAVQWKPGLVPQIDCERASSGPSSDPTARIALDTNRLRVRTAVIAGLRTMDDCTRALNNAARDLDRALRAWEGA